jgi:molybdopterin synthase sulfur carrier subunit
MLRGALARILVIDDNDTMREGMAVSLKKAGHEVWAFRAGPDAVAAYEKRPADLVVTDLTEGDGDEAVAGKTVKEALGSLDKDFPGIGSRILEQGGAVRRFVNVYVNDKDIRGLKQLDTEVKDTDVLSIVPAIAGGAPTTFQEILSGLKTRIPEIQPEELRDSKAKPFLLDVRERAEDLVFGDETVAVLVFEDADAADGLFAFGRAVGIIAHLDDPELAVGGKRHGHRAFELRLGGDQLDAQALGELKELLRLGGRERLAGAARFLCGFLGHSPVRQ